MLFEQQDRLSARHLIEHFQDLIPTSIDHSCIICFPQPQVITTQFQNFWDWIEKYYFGETFTLYTVQALQTYFIAFNNDPNNTKSQQVIDLAVKIFLSISYSQRPWSFPDLLFIFLNYTHRSNYFQDPITSELIQRFEADNNNYSYAAGVTGTSDPRSLPTLETSPSSSILSNTPQTESNPINPT